MTSSTYSLNDAGAHTDYSVLWERTRGVFASLRYAEAAGNVFGLKSQICIVGDEAALLVHLKGTVPFRRIVVPPCTQYSAFLLPESIPSHVVHRGNSPLDELLRFAEELSSRADLLVALEDPRTAKWRGWQIQPLFTYKITLPTRSENWSSGTRRTWHSKRSRYEILEDINLASQVIDLCAKSYKKHGRSLPARPEALEALTLAMGDWARVVVAVRGNTAEAGIILLHDGQTAHYWIAGSTPGPAMTVLIGEILPILSQSGITTFDFVGANTPSIAEFKRTFNPVLSQYYHLRRRPQMYFGR